MATTDTVVFSRRNKTCRVYFFIDDSSGAPITAPWTGISGGCQVIQDVTVGTPVNIVQVAGTSYGYVEIPSGQTNCNALGIRPMITNVNALSPKIVVILTDTDPVAVANPTTLSLEQMIVQLWQYTFGRVTNDGTNVKMFDLDGSTQLAVMPITGQIEKGAAF